MMPDKRAAGELGDSLDGTVAQVPSATPLYWRTSVADAIWMRLSFLNGEHADFVVENGVISLGHADGNTLVLAGRDIAPWHARINVDQRGIVLEVLDFASRTHVNARPVREKALLRLGDVLCLGVVAMMLKPDRDDAIETTLPPEPEDGDDAADSTPARVVLRGVAGSHFGRAIALRQRLVVGRAADCDIVVDDAQIAPHHATIETIEETICLRDMGSGAGALVNGLRLPTAVLHQGDQIAFGRDHFLIEAPGMPLRGEIASVPSAADSAEANGASAQATPADTRGSIWWLIGAAALIALGLVWILLRGA
jgi:pSer/pThr/pTyr-binding forkhead associated (FHA) protein